MSTSTSSSEESIPPIPRKIANYWLEETLGAGYSGSIYRARHLHTNDVVALKVQHVNHECPTNRYERGFYPTLQGGKGMPRLWASGIETCWDYLAIDLLGPSLDNLYRKSGKDTMDLRSVCCIAMQVISRLELMHNRGILHRDIQLGNCVIGLPPNDKTVYMIDFGFSKRYIDPNTHRHIPDSKAKRDFIGNYWFSSVGVHCRGKVPSRRDDLEAAALMFIHLLTPRGLPWTRNGVPKTDAAHDILKREKQNAQPEDLCRGMPSEFEEFLRYCRRLKFQDCPDYSQWIEEFRELAISHGYPDSDDFVWPPPVQTVHRPPRRSQAPEPEDIIRILDGLKQLDIGKRPVLGDRSNVEEAVRKAREDAQKSNSGGSGTLSNDTVPSDGEESNDTVPPPFMTLKAYKLSKLTAKVSKAIDNRELAQRVHEFVAVMKSNTSRTLTKDGFAFLDALYKQLGDPSVFTQPMRTSRTKDKAELAPDRSNAKLGVVARLREQVTHARNNKSLAAMVQDFGNVTNRSSGRTVTKDGFAFLEGLAKQLESLA